MKSLVSTCAGGLILVVLLAMGGCVSKAEYDQCVRRNQLQQERIDGLESGEGADRVRAERLARELELLGKQKGYWQKQIDTLMVTLKEKNDLIDELSQQVGGQVVLPPELSSALAEWSDRVGSELVSYDEETGIVRFKSDLLFEKGEAMVQSEAAAQLEGLSQIMNSSAAEGFDILIVGHTDDVPIERPSTKAKHADNWYLSAHRAIAVEDVLATAGMAEKRMSVMGMGEFRPIAPNKPNKKGNPLNRRVEVYIVPAGQIHVGGTKSS